jgi:hypothetical protein
MSDVLASLSEISGSTGNDESTNHDFDLENLSLFEGNSVGKKMNDILQMVSSTLVTFTLVYFSERFMVFTADSQHNPLLNHSFPCLTELTVRGPHQLPSSPNFAPELRRLHITEESMTPQFISTAVSNHPLLTHVRLSRLLDITGDFSMIVDFLVAMNLLPRTKEDSEAPQMTRGIRRWFIVEPGVIIQTHRSRRGGMKTREKRLPQGHNLLADKFKVIRRFSPTCLLLRDHPGHGKSLETHNSREEWLDRLKGAPGCWLVVVNSGQIVKIFEGMSW